MRKNDIPKYKLLIFLFFLAVLTISTTQNGNSVNEVQTTPRGTADWDTEIYIWQSGETPKRIIHANSAENAIKIDPKKDIFLRYNITYNGLSDANVAYLKITVTYAGVDLPSYEADIEEESSRDLFSIPISPGQNITGTTSINLKDADIGINVESLSVGVYKLKVALFNDVDERLWGPVSFYIKLTGNPLTTVVGAVAAVSAVIGVVGVVSTVASGAGASSASSLSGSQPFGMDNTFVQAIAKGTDVSARKIAGASRHIVANRCGDCWMEVPHDAKFCIACGVGLATVISLKMKKFRESISKLIERQKENPEAEITPEKVSQDTGMSEEMAKDAIQAMVNKDLLEGEKMKKKRISAKSFARFGASLTFSILLWAQLLGWIPMPSFYWVIAWIAGATIFFGFFGGFIARRAAAATYRIVKREKCPSCGKRVDPAWTHCHKCGTTLPFAAAVAPAEPAEAAIVEEEKTEVEEEETAAVEEEKVVEEEEEKGIEKAAELVELGDVKGVGTVILEKLETAGISSTKDLLEGDLEKIAEESDVPVGRLEKIKEAVKEAVEEASKEEKES